MANKTSLNTVLSPVKVGDKADLLEKKANQDRIQEIIAGLDTEARRQAFVNSHFSGLDKKAQEGLEQIVFLLMEKNK